MTLGFPWCGAKEQAPTLSLMQQNRSNNALYLTAIPLRSIAAGELCRYVQKVLRQEISA